MSKRGKRKKKKAKVKKISFKDKSWYEVIAPKSFDYKVIGEIIGLKGTLKDRVIETLLFDFTDNFDDINLKLKYRVKNVNEETNKCESFFIGHQYTNDYIRSLVGRGATKIQSIDNLTTKDGFTFRVTSACVTIRRARSSQQLLIRKIMRDILKEFAKSLNHEKFIVGMIYGEFENQIIRVAKTVYPLSSCTIVKSKLIAYPEGVEDQEVEDRDFDIVEVDVKRSRKSEIKRTERINVKKFSRERAKAKEEEEEEEEESIDEEKGEEEEEEEESIDEEKGEEEEEESIDEEKGEEEPVIEKEA